MGRKITFIVLIATLSFGTLPGVVVNRADAERKGTVKIFSFGGSSFSSPNLILSEDNRITEEENDHLANIERKGGREEDTHFLSFASGYHPETLSEITHNPRAPPRKV